MLLIEESFSVENVFFYLRLLGKSLKEQKITILTSGYQYSLWRMSSDSGSKINTFIWKWGRTIDKTSHPHTAARGGCVLARCPPGSSLSAEGSKIWGYWTDSTDNHGLSAVPRRVPSEQRRARAGPGRARGSLSPWPSRRGMKLILAAMTFCVGTGLRVPVTINQQTEYLPRSLKRTFYTE